MTSISPPQDVVALAQEIGSRRKKGGYPNQEPAYIYSFTRANLLQFAAALQATPRPGSPSSAGVSAPDDGGLYALVMACALAILTGQPTVTISVASKRPAGFPRTTLLSVGSSGRSNYAVDPVKVLAWIYPRTKAGQSIRLDKSSPRSEA